MVQTLSERNEHFREKLAQLKWTCARHNSTWKFWRGPQARDFHEGGEQCSFHSFKEAEAFIEGLWAFRASMYDLRTDAVQLLDEGHVQQKIGPGRLVTLLKHIADL